MDSTVKVCLFSFFIGFASAAIDADCQFVGEFCDPEDSIADTFKLSDAATDMTTAIDECYDECNAQKDDPDSPCKSFTVRQVGLRPPTCYLLRNDCVLNSADACITSDPANPSCASGPSDCTSFEPEVCPMVATLEGDFARWQCQDINTDPINPYNADVPEGTVCYQTCSSWVSEEGVEGPPGQLVSKCESGGWSVVVSSDPSDVDGALFYPTFPDGSTYPTPDADAATALPCGCQPLNVQWPYGPDVDPADQVWYDPNREEAAEFICETTVDMANQDYIIETTNTCVLYCDDHYVATASCLNGEWTGNPEWGFWCYEEPVAIA